MNHSHQPAALPEPTIRMTEGWHRAAGCDELVAALNPDAPSAPKRLQISVVSGHKADLALMLLDPDPLVIDRVEQAVRSSRLGPVLETVWSFVSITEISEYVPSVDQYAARLQREGADPSDAAFRARIDAYNQRLPAMNRQRLYPDFPDLPVMSFYPMNKIRHPQANWYTRPFSSRSAMMAEHATSGIRFAGRVSQLITASTGFDDWEWGVTLWARAPEHIKEIVYSMRFDQASARYAEFGPFYISYIMPIADAIDHLRLRP